MRSLEERALWLRSVVDLEVWWWWRRGVGDGVGEEEEEEGEDLSK